VTVYEAAAHVGGHVRAWGHVRMFTPWDLNVSPRMWAHLATIGWSVADCDRYPTGREFAERVLDAVAGLPALAGRIRLGTRVEHVARDGLLKHEQVGSQARRCRPFRLLVTGPDGTERVERADVVLDCSGNLGNPNAIGEGGIPAPGERALGTRIRRTLPDLAAERDEWAGRHVLLVGAGKSAQTAARDLAELARQEPGTRVQWVVRDPNPDWGEVPDDALPQRQALVDAARRFAAGHEPAVRVRPGTTVAGLSDHGERIGVCLTDRRGRVEHVEVDRVLGLTGYMPAPDLYRQLQVHECYATAAPIRLAAALLGDPAPDCLHQHTHGVDTLRNPEPDFFVLGVKSYGRDSRFLLPVGYDQVDEVTSTYPPYR
jgi:hypothetical protein